MAERAVDVELLGALSREDLRETLSDLDRLSAATEAVCEAMAELARSLRTLNARSD